MIEPRLLKRLETKKDQLDGFRPLPAAAINRLNPGRSPVSWLNGAIGSQVQKGQYTFSSSPRRLTTAW